MARTVLPLNDTKIKNAKPREKSYTLADGQGLQLLIKTNGTKLWEFRYISPISYKRRKTSFDKYPVVTLAIARSKRDEYLELIKNKIDPIDYFKEQKLQEKQEIEKQNHTIANLIDEYFKFREDELSPSTIKKDRTRIKYSFTDKLNKKEDTSIYELNFITIKSILLKIEEEKKLDPLKKVKGIILRVLKFAFKRDILDTSELIGKLELYDFKKQSKKQIRNNPTLINKNDIAKLYNDILNYNHSLITRYLLLMTIHTAQRQGSLITAKWEDIDFKKNIWTIPADNMKVKTQAHILPLSNITIKYLTELKVFTGSNEYLFPNSQIKSTRNKYPYVSNNTARTALRRMGYTNEQQTAHGFRAMFKTICKENQEEYHLNNEFVERILAHKVEGDVEAAYNRANNIEDMRKVVNWWSDWLEELKN